MRWPSKVGERDGRGLDAQPREVLGARLLDVCSGRGGHSGDEVGLGKTIEAGLVLRSLLLRGEVGRGLIIAPRNLVRQWMEELREKLALTAWFYDGRYLTDVGGRLRESRAPLDEDGLLITDLRAVATDSKFSVFQERLTQVLDEGHRVIVCTQYRDTPWFTPAISTDHARCRARLHRAGRRRLRRIS